MITNILTALLDPDTYIWLAMLVMALLTIGILVACCRTRRRWLRVSGLLAVLLGWYVLLYGTFIGFSQLEVRRVEFASEDLPAAFDGYRIVQFSDVHIGTFTGWRAKLLKRAIDSINAQKADLIVFTGDLQNKYPEEIEERTKQLSRLKAKDGICSVLGNHDYPEYSERDEFHRSVDIGRTCSAEIEMDWCLLNNGYHRIRRGQEQIIIAGMENDGEGRFPQLGNISSSLIGLNRKSFVVMLEHDPTSWRRKILPHSHCQLTLSGHTHGGQFSVLGLSPAMFKYPEWHGMYYMGKRAMNVTSGLGAVVPFRFGASPEIVVITLKKK